MKKGTITIITLITALIILIVSVLLWQSHIHHLRTDMENHIAAANVYFERTEIQHALTESTEAQLLAERLRDDDAQRIANTQIQLAKQLILGNNHFDTDRYKAARTAYLQSLEYAFDLDALNPDFIFDLIAIMDNYIHFYALMEHADRMIASERFDDALTLYQDAFLVAVSFFFVDGKMLAIDGMTHAEELIIAAKRAQAGAFEAQGTASFHSGNYDESIAHFQRALYIYQELGDSRSVHSIHTNIDLVERRIEERRRQALQAEQEALEILEALTAETAASAAAQDNALRDAQDGSEATVRDESEALSSNYEHNRSIFFDLNTLINNQALPPANQIRMGTHPGLNEGWYNGCGWISAYNALIILESPMHPAEIVNHFETRRGTVLGGMFGTFPHAIEGLFRALGYDVNHVLFPQRSLNLDDAIRNSRVSILAYTHTRAAHFIAIVYRAEDGLFVVYNDSFARQRSAALGLENAHPPGATIDSVTELIRDNPDMLFSFSLIVIS
ncbi:MAG: tetratricopeptide repeat protein [Oscillospiraceae bacterium]|nr:tetratricopeptide repeat protein [Oscillospiraceae bacterium]